MPESRYRRHLNCLQPLAVGDFDENGSLNFSVAVGFYVAALYVCATIVLVIPS